MQKNTPQQAVARYYSRIGSRLGYRLVMKKSQHFGYYDENHTDEPSAQRKYHEEFAKILDLQSGMKVLDAGCGQGVVASYLAENHDVHVTGITIVPYEVESAKQTAREQGVEDSTHFLLADYADPPLTPGSFNRIYTTETLSHAVDVEVVLYKFMELLKPGGLLVCAEYEFDFDNFNKKERWAAEFVKEHAAIHGIYQFGPGQFLASIKKVGFKDARETNWTRHMAPSFNRLRQIAKPMLPIVRTLKIERFFINTVAANMYAVGVDRGVFFYKVYRARK